MLLPDFLSARARAALTGALLLAVLGTLPLVASADELQDVSKLVAAGKYDDAERRADAFLARTPKDAQMRFLKGVILSQRGQRDAAIAMFTGLTQDYPELPEPYNNLAVLYASQGRYDEARSALEMAIRVSPNDATAYENLGDTYAALAARAYRDARRYDNKSASSQRKLDAVRALLITPTGALASTTATAPVASASVPSAPAAVASTPRSQRSVGLPYPAGPAAATLGGTLAQAPDIVVPSEATIVPQGSAVAGIETTPAEPQAPSAPLTGSATTVGTDPSTAIADVTAATRRWAAQRTLAADTPVVRIDGDVAEARVTTRDVRAPRAAAARHVLTLRLEGDGWKVTRERIE